jgi:hypothetical protein
VTDFIVLHDGISYTHPENNPLPGQPTALAFAVRGDVLSTEDSGEWDQLPCITEKEAKKLLAYGAVCENDDSTAARLARAGQRPDTGAAPDMHALSLRSPEEAVRAAKAVGGGMVGGGSGPASRKTDLARLALADLKVMGSAFGAPADLLDSGNNDGLLDFLTGADESATAADEIAEQRQLRDEAQVSAREYQGEGGLVGTNVAAGGVRGDTGEKSDAPGASEPKPKSRRKSKAQAKGDGADSSAEDDE